MTQEPFEELDGDQEISDLENHNSCDDREAIEPEEPEDVSRRDFFRKSAEIAAMALFGSVGIDLLVEEVTGRVKEFEGISKLADALGERLQSLGFPRDVSAQSEPSCAPANMFDNCVGPGPVECDIAGGFSCNNTHWFHAECGGIVDHTCDGYDCASPADPQLIFACGIDDEMVPGGAGFECDDFTCSPGDKNNGDAVMDFACYGNPGLGGNDFDCNGNSFRCESLHAFMCVYEFDCEAQSFLCNPNADGKADCNQPGWGNYRGYGDQNGPGDFLCVAGRRRGFECDNNFACGTGKDNQDFICGQADDRGFPDPQLTFGCPPEWEQYTFDPGCTPADDGDHFYCLPPVAYDLS